MPDSHLDENGFVVLDETDIPSAAQVRAAQIAACELCDGDGYHGSSVCDHIDHRAAAERGMALVREALAKADPGVPPQIAPRDAQRPESASKGDW